MILYSLVNVVGKVDDECFVYIHSENNPMAKLDSNGLIYNFSKQVAFPYRICK